MELSKNAKRIQEELKKFKDGFEIIELPESTRTSLEAARVAKCKLGQIAKAIIFESEKNEPVLVIASGSNRINEHKIEKIIMQRIKKADADFVKAKTGFPIGGVPPIGHKNKIKIFIDEDLMKFGEVWGAAGTSNAIFKLTPKELVRMTKGRIIDIKE